MHAVLTNTQMWDQDLTQISGLEAAVLADLGVGQHSVHQLGSGVILVGIVEVQSPCVILDLVGVARCV